MRRLAFVLVMLAACSGDPPPNSQNKCTGALYDLCSTEHDCTGMNCRTFTSFEVCTQACDASNPCPNDATGSPAACNGGLCQPAMANDCHL